MPKFSIIITVYNTAPYLPKCFDSALAQKFDDYEIIVVNDGSTDNSQKIIDKYAKRYKKKFKCFITENQGVSNARNTGVKKAKGEYFIFLDSDDYIEKNLLKRLDDNSSDQVDLIRFQLKTIRINYKIKERYYEEEFYNLSGYEAFVRIANFKYVEKTWCYAYNRKFYNKNKFSFESGRYREDFGLIPLVIMKATSVTSINYIGYNYMEREEDIILEVDYKENKKIAYDVLDQYNNLYKEIKKDKQCDKDLKKVFNNFIASYVILKARDLDNSDLKKFDEKLDKLGIKDEILDDTLKRKIKKILLRLNIKLYLRVIR